MCTKAQPRGTIFGLVVTAKRGCSHVLQKFCTWHRLSYCELRARRPEWTARIVARWVL